MTFTSHIQKILKAFHFCCFETKLNLISEIDVFAKPISPASFRMLLNWSYYTAVNQ